MDILIPTGVQKGHISGKKSPHNLLKNVLSKLYFQPEGDWYGNFLFYILTIYCKCLLFQLLDRSIRVHIPILTEVQKRQISCYKGVHDLPKNILLRLNFQHDGQLTSMPNA